MEKQGQRQKGQRGFKHDCDLYTGGKHLGDTPDIFTDYVRFSHVARHEAEVSDWQNQDEGYKGGGTLPIFCDMSLVFMEFYRGKKVVSVEVYFMGTPEFEWIHNW